MKPDKSQWIKVLRVLVYEGDVNWIAKTLVRSKIKPHKELLIPTTGKITETFRGSQKEFIAKIMGEVK